MPKCIDLRVFAAESGAGLSALDGLPRAGRLQSGFHLAFREHAEVIEENRIQLLSPIPTETPHAKINYIYSVEAQGGPVGLERPLTRS